MFCHDVLVATSPVALTFPLPPPTGTSPTYQWDLRHAPAMPVRRYSNQRPRNSRRTWWLHVIPGGKRGCFVWLKKGAWRLWEVFWKFGDFFLVRFPCKYDIVWIHDTRCEILWIVIFMQVHQTFLGNLMIFCLILSHPGKGSASWEDSLQQFW